MLDMFVAESSTQPDWNSPPAPFRYRTVAPATARMGAPGRGVVRGGATRTYSPRGRMPSCAAERRSWPGSAQARAAPREVKTTEARTRRVDVIQYVLQEAGPPC